MRHLTKRGLRLTLLYGRRERYYFSIKCTAEVYYPEITRRGFRDKSREGILTHATYYSQSSLLIEYFENNKELNIYFRLSVRVKIMPSPTRNIKDTNEQVQVTASKGDRKPSYTRRISPNPHYARDRQTTESANDEIDSYTSIAEELNKIMHID